MERKSMENSKCSLQWLCRKGCHLQGFHYRTVCHYSGDHRTTARKGIRDRSHLPVLPNEEANTQRLPDLPGASAGDSV